MEFYLEVNKNKRTINILSSVDLFHKMSKANIIKMEDLKSTTFFRDFLQKRKEYGFPIFKFEEINAIQLRLIHTTVGKKDYFFNNMDEAVDFIKKNNYSSAKDGVITSTIHRALTGKIKTGYKLKWSYIYENIDSNDYTLIYKEVQ